LLATQTCLRLNEEVKWVTPIGIMGTSRNGWRR
jgi:hypothetical protein